MTDRPDAPEASKAPGAPDAAARMTREREASVTVTLGTTASKSVSGGESGEGAKDAQLGRRKLLYAAPVVMSQSMFYALAGCGKAQPQQLNCFRVPRSGS
jgi:hypothetical protein